MLFFNRLLDAKNMVVKLAANLSSTRRLIALLAENRNAIMMKVVYTKVYNVQPYLTARYILIPLVMPDGN